MRWSLFAAALLACSSAALAGDSVAFTPAVGEAPVLKGDAGVKQTSFGIDYWIAGLPFGKYQILGFISDGKRWPLFSKKPMGSKAISKLAVSSGGNAIIVLNEPVATLDTASVGQILEKRHGAWSVSAGTDNASTPTIFVVIRHLGLAK